jgi:hypothetical protein
MDRKTQRFHSLVWRFPPAPVKGTNLAQYGRFQPSLRYGSLEMTDRRTGENSILYRRGGTRVLNEDLLCPEPG